MSRTDLVQRIRCGLRRKRYLSYLMDGSPAETSHNVISAYVETRHHEFNSVFVSMAFRKGL